MSETAPHVRVIEGRSSWRSRALSAFLRLIRNRPLLLGDDVSALRRSYEAIDARHFGVEPWVKRESVDCDGVSAEWVSVPESQADRIVLYLHGGSFAFRFPNAHAAFAARLCQRLGARALIPDYRLSPEHPFPAAPDDCQAVYRWLLANGHDPRNIVFVGDSAGGNLALVTLYRAIKAGERVPACAVLLSPAVDCTFTSPSMVANGDSDPMLRLSSLLVLRSHYVPAAVRHTHPEVSPLYADFVGYPPLFIQAGSSEMLRDEAVQTAQKATAAGVDVELEVWPETPHVFQIVSFLPESTRALASIEQFVRARTGWDAPSSAESLGRSINIMSKRRKTAVPDFSTKKGPTARGPIGQTPVAPPVSPKQPAIKPQATSAKSGHRGQ